MILGGGLAIRALTPGDRERWLELLHDPEQRRFGTPAFVVRPTSVEELDTRGTQSREHFAAGEPTALCVSDESDPDRFLGLIAWRIELPDPTAPNGIRRHDVCLNGFLPGS